MRTMLLAACITAALAPSPAVAQTAFPAARLAFFNAQRVAAESATGQAAAARLEAFRSTTATEIDERNQALTAERQKLQQAAALLNAPARVQLERNIRRFELDIQRFIEDAQAEFVRIQQEVEGAFQLKLLPVVEEVAKEQGIHFVFDRLSPAIFWADPAYDVTAEIIERLDETANN